MELIHRMELQYDGTGLHGWAKQPGLSTVEGSLEEALQTAIGSAPAMSVAGRTDTGVHARRQVVGLALSPKTDCSRLARSLNALTPPGIAVTSIAPARASFDARNDAVGRTYRYYVCTLPVVPPFWDRYCWHIPYELDDAVLHTCAAGVAGRHDFTAFTPTQTEHVFFERTILRCAWKRDAQGLGALRPVDGTSGNRQGRGLFYLEIEANAYLRHMVRTLVGTILEVGQGRRTLDDFIELLAGSSRLGAGLTAPPQGLFLWDVRYR